MGAFLFLVAITWLATYVAKSKNRSPWKWGIATFIFTPCIIVLAFMSKIDNNL